jgi:hypothetical protein
MSAGGTPGSVEGLYEQLASPRAGRARAVLAQQAGTRSIAWGKRLLRVLALPVAGGR